MKLDFLIAGSATPAFFSQIAFFRLCLDNLGDIYADARLVAVFGDHLVEDIPIRWRRHFDRIDVEWAHKPGAPNPLHRAQNDRRFEVIRDDADLAFLCDADVALLRRPDDLLQKLKLRPALAGTIAHYHFTNPDHENVPQTQRKAEEDWTRLASDIIGKSIELPHRYTLLDRSSAQRAPFYINYGVFCGTPDLLTAFYKRDIQLREKVSAVMGDWWGPQVSLALTVADLDLPNVALPMRYNYPNDPISDQMYPEEMERIVFLHYLRLKHFDRQRIFTEQGDFDAFLKGKFCGSNEIFRSFVETICHSVYPFD